MTTILRQSSPHSTIVPHTNAPTTCATHHTIRATNVTPHTHSLAPTIRATSRIPLTTYYPAPTTRATHHTIRATSCTSPSNYTAHTHHRLFTVFCPTVHFTPDSGATDILIRESDSHILLHHSNFTPMDHPPAFAVANNALIYPTATGQLHLPSTTIYLDAYIFVDHELADNIFGLAPLVNQGLTATFSNTKVSFDAPTTADPRIILYGTKHPSENVWHFSLPRHEPRAMTIVRNETHAEIAMYAAASFRHPSSRTFHRAVQLGYLSNYPDLTAPMLRRNRPHTPATALEHIAASRLNVRSTRRSPISKDASDTSSSDSVAPKRVSAVTRSQKRPSAPPDLVPCIRKRVRILSPTRHAITSKPVSAQLQAYVPEILTPYQPH